MCDRNKTTSFDRYVEAFIRSAAKSLDMSYEDLVKEFKTKMVIPDA